MLQSTDGNSSCGRLARPSGAFAMVAVDHRETLCSMFESAGHAPVSDEELVDFKRGVLRAVSGSASAVLVDPRYGLPAIGDAGELPPGCALILAADRFRQKRGGPLEDTEIETGAADIAVRTGAIAMKLLVLWQSEADSQRLGSLVARFVSLCRRRGLLSIVEGVLRSEDRDRHEVRVAQELAAAGPDLYKAQMPTLGRGTLSTIRRKSEAITAAVPCPWVVLSAGVPGSRFRSALAVACDGGASGFLAGAYIWGDAIPLTGSAPTIASDALARRVADLVALVDDHARPWHQATTAAGRSQPTIGPAE